MRGLCKSAIGGVALEPVSCMETSVLSFALSTPNLYN